MNHDATAPVVIRPGTLADAPVLAEFGATTFRAAYAAAAPTDALDAFVLGTFSAARQAAELADAGSRFLLAHADEELVGYALLSDVPPPPPVVGARPVSLARLYVAPAAQGRRVGTALMSRALGLARASGHDVLWLTVWDANQRARAFYDRWGFVDVGEVAFDLAGEPQIDRVLQRPCEEAEPRRMLQADAERRQGHRQLAAGDRGRSRCAPGSCGTPDH